jgi:hypothetical protein
VLSFQSIVRAVQCDLMRLDVEPSTHKRDRSVAEPEKGIHGTLYNGASR